MVSKTLTALTIAGKRRQLLSQEQLCGHCDGDRGNCGGEEEKGAVAQKVRQDSGHHAPGQVDNELGAGEDVGAGQTVLARGHWLRPAELGLLASLGINEVDVFRRLRVAFFSTGDELRPVGSPLALGEIYDSNRYTLYGMLTRLGCEVLDLGQQILGKAHPSLRSTGLERRVYVVGHVADLDHLVHTPHTTTCDTHVFLRRAYAGQTKSGSRRRFGTSIASSTTSKSRSLSKYA